VELSTACRYPVRLHPSGKVRRNPSAARVAQIPQAPAGVERSTAAATGEGRRVEDVVPAAASALGMGGGPGHPRRGGAPRHHPLRPRLGRDLHAGTRPTLAPANRWSLKLDAYRSFVWG
jgi:hypothetical protein